MGYSGSRLPCPNRTVGARPPGPLSTRSRSGTGTVARRPPPLLPPPLLLPPLLPLRARSRRRSSSSNSPVAGRRSSSHPRPPRALRSRVRSSPTRRRQGRELGLPPHSVLLSPPLSRSVSEDAAAQGCGGHSGQSGRQREFAIELRLISVHVRVAKPRGESHCFRTRKPAFPCGPTCHCVVVVRAVSCHTSLTPADHC